MEERELASATLCAGCIRVSRQANSFHYSSYVGSRFASANFDIANLHSHTPSTMIHDAEEVVDDVNAVDPRTIYYTLPLLDPTVAHCLPPPQRHAMV
jgi:hypothetical protein